MGVPISANRSDGAGRGESDPPPPGQGGLPDVEAEARLTSSFQQVRAVLRGRDFRRLWLVMSFSSFGDWLGLLATTALATELAHGYQAANFALGGVLVVRLLPAVVLGPVAGAFADRFDRRRTMVVADVTRFALFVSIPLAHSLWWLFVASFLIECVGLFWIPAKEATVPNLVRRDRLEAANQVSLVTTYGITPVIAALVFSGLALVSRSLSSSVSFFKTNQLDLALYINALTFLVSALTVLSIRRISRVRSLTRDSSPGVFRLIHEGWAFIGSTRLVRGLVFGLVGAFAGCGAVIGTGKIYAASLGGGDATYGALFGAIFVGLGLGMGLGPRVARDLSRRRLFGLSITFAGGCLVTASLMPHLLLSVVMVIGVGFGGGLAYLSGTTLVGHEVADEIRGRTFAFLQSMLRVVMIATLAAVPFLVGVVQQRRIDFGPVDFVLDGTRVLLAAAGLVAIVGGLIAYRQLDDRSGVPIFADLFTSVRGDTTARRRLAHGGTLVAFEGGEGSGKSTQAARLAEWLRERGVSVTLTHEPGATDFGEVIRRVVLQSEDGGLTPRAEALLFAADRAHHVDTVIRPALDRGDVVITDRYADSSLAYQGAGRSLAVEDIRRLSRWATGGLEADLTVLLDIDPELGLQRARSSDGGEPDRLERESLEFHSRVRDAFRGLADAAPGRYVVVDASRHPEAVAAVIRATVSKRLAGRLSAHRAPARSGARPSGPGSVRGSGRGSGRSRLGPLRRWANGRPNPPRRSATPTPDGTPTAASEAAPSVSAARPRTRQSSAPAPDGGAPR
jgi:dTMP kinase